MSVVQMAFGRGTTADFLCVYACIEARSRISHVDNFRIQNISKFRNLDLSHVPERGHKRTGTEMKGKTMSLKWR